MEFSVQKYLHPRTGDQQLPDTTRKIGSKENLTARNTAGRVLGAYKKVGCRLDEILSTPSKQLLTLHVQPARHSFSLGTSMLRGGGLCYLDYLAQLLIRAGI